MKPLILFALIVTNFALGWWLISSKTIPQDSIKTNDPSSRQIKSSELEKIPNLKLQKFNGEEVALVNFIGRPLVINAWATWCPPCKQELLDFATLQDEFKNQIVIIAINRAESKEIAKKFTDELGVMDKLTFLLDPSDSFFQAVGGFGMPATIFVDSNGNVRSQLRGRIKIDTFRERIKLLLN